MQEPEIKELEWAINNITTIHIFLDFFFWVFFSGFLQALLSLLMIRDHLENLKMWNKRKQMYAFWRFFNFIFFK